MDFISGHPDFDSHEQVVFCHDRRTGLRAIIAVHDTTCGPGYGGTRVWPYESEAAALTDVPAGAASSHANSSTTVLTLPYPLSDP